MDEYNMSKRAFFTKSGGIRWRLRSKERKGRLFGHFQWLHDLSARGRGRSRIHEVMISRTCTREKERSGYIHEGTRKGGMAWHGMALAAR